MSGLDDKWEIIACPECEGTGKEECYECEGEGICPDDEDKACKECAGTGELECGTCDGDRQVYFNNENGKIRKIN